MKREKKNSDSIVKFLAKVRSTQPFLVCSNYGYGMVVNYFSTRVLHLSGKGGKIDLNIFWYIIVYI